jgi:hypothetical protein
MDLRPRRSQRASLTGAATGSARCICSLWTLTCATQASRFRAVFADDTDHRGGPGRRTCGARGALRPKAVRSHQG